MKKIELLGNTPRPVQLLFGGKASNIIWNKYGIPEIWECTNVDELGKNAHLDSCELQVLIDKPNNRYYLTAMTIDGERVKAKLDEDETGIILVEDTSPKSSTTIYYTQITAGQYLEWAKADAIHRNKNRDR